MRQRSPGELRYLRRFICAWCRQPLDLDWCGGVSDPCAGHELEARRDAVLLDYAPRQALNQSPRQGGRRQRNRYRLMTTARRPAMRQTPGHGV